MIFWPKENDMFHDILAQKLMIFLPKIKKICLKKILKILLLLSKILLFFGKKMIFLANIKNIDIIITISKYYY